MCRGRGRHLATEEPSHCRAGENFRASLSCVARRRTDLLRLLVALALEAAGKGGAQARQAHTTLAAAAFVPSASAAAFSPLSQHSRRHGFFAKDGQLFLSASTARILAIYVWRERVLTSATPKTKSF